MEKLTFKEIPREKLPEHEYEYLVYETSKLLGMPFIQVHKMVEKWTLGKIRDRLNEAAHHHGRLTPRVFWLWKRKMDRVNTSR